MAAVFCLLVSLAAGQNDAAKDKAIAQMRGIAKAIRQCPEQTESQDECWIFLQGPPANVEWDVSPSKTVRSPFQGTIEFTVPRRRLDVDPVKQTTRVQQKCAVIRKLAEEGMRANPSIRFITSFHYRYEFDLGPDGPELVKMLSLKDDGTKEAVAADGGGNECWAKIARSFNSTKAENTSPVREKSK